MSGDEYVPAALCLRDQLRFSGSSCPLTLVYDESKLSDESIARVTRVYGSEQLVALTELFARAKFTVQNARRMVLVDSRARRRAGRLTAANQSIYPSGRDWEWELGALQKLWLWALPPTLFPVVAFLDLDTLISANLDP